MKIVIYYFILLTIQLVLYLLFENYNKKKNDKLMNFVLFCMFMILLLFV